MKTTMSRKTAKNLPQMTRRQINDVFKQLQISSSQYDVSKGASPVFEKFSLIKHVDMIVEASN